MKQRKNLDSELLFPVNNEKGQIYFRLTTVRSRSELRNGHNMAVEKDNCN